MQNAVVRAVLQHKRGSLIVSLEGAANSLVEPLEDNHDALDAIEKQIQAFDTKRLIVDLRDLCYIDSGFMKAMFLELADWSERLTVRLVGPGRAFRCLDGLLAVPAPVQFSPTVTAALEASGSAFDVTSSRWKRFLDQFQPHKGGMIISSGIRKNLGRELTIDLDEEAAYLASEGDPRNHNPPYQPIVFQKSQRGVH